MSSIENEILLGAEEDAREVEFIQNYIGSEWREQITEEDIYYILDVFGEYIETHFGNADGEVDIDVDDIVKFVAKKAKKEEMGPYDNDLLSLVINAEFDYNEQLED